MQGKTRSCGCLKVDEAARRQTTHGQTGSALYRRWRAMINRVTNVNFSDYANYGGRGIEVCARWLDFANFAMDMGPTFEPHLELDRRDNDGNYEPGNCRWADRRTQQRNRRTNHIVTHNGESLTVQEWGERLDIKPNTIVTRLRRGWSVDRALSRTAELSGGPKGQR